MSQIRREHASERISKELIEADFEIAFNLVDMAGEESTQGEFASATRALHDAEDVFADIERRLTVINDYDRQSFAPLLGELKRALGLAKSLGWSSS